MVCDRNCHPATDGLSLLNLWLDGLIGSSLLCSGLVCMDPGQARMRDFTG